MKNCYEKVARRSGDEFLDVLKELDSNMKQKKQPVNIDYYGSYAEVNMPENIIQKILNSFGKGKFAEYIAKIYAYNARTGKMDLSWYDPKKSEYVESRGQTKEQLMNKLSLLYKNIISSEESCKKKSESNIRISKRKRVM